MSRSRIWWSINHDWAYSGLQKRIENFVQTLTLWIAQPTTWTSANLLEVNQFYDIVQETYVFFSKRLPQWQELNQVLQEDGMKKNLIPKKMCSTRWYSRYDCLLVLRNNFWSVMKCLYKLILLCTKNQKW